METDPKKIIEEGAGLTETLTLADGTVLPGRGILTRNETELYLTVENEIDLAKMVLLFADSEKTKEIIYTIKALMIDRAPIVWSGYTRLTAIRRTGNSLSITMEYARQ